MVGQSVVPRRSRAAVLREFNAPLDICEVPVPDLVPGSLLVRIDAATVCGSDVHNWDGTLSRTVDINLPVIPGHEMVGRIVAFGAGERTDSAGERLELDDRIVFTHGRCGSCHYCVVLNRPHLCANRSMYAFLSCEQPPYLVGGFAEYCYVFPTSCRFRVPNDVKTEWASAASCALRSVLLSFDRLGRIEPWETVIVQGAGPLGLFATAVAHHNGAGRIIVLGDPPDRLAVARDWGATETLSITDYPSPRARVDAAMSLTGGAGADVVMELSGARTAFPEAVEMARRGGRVVVTGQVGPHEVSIRPARIMQRELTIVGSFSGDASQYWRALQFLARARDRYDFDRLLSRRYGLHEVTLALSRMKAFEEIKPIIDPSLTN